MKKSSLRKALLVINLGWTALAFFITPPVETYEIIITLILILFVYILEFIDNN